MDTTGRGGWRRRGVDQDIFVGSSGFQLFPLQNPSSTWVRNHTGGDGQWSSWRRQGRERATTAMLPMLAKMCKYQISCRVAAVTRGGELEGGVVVTRVEENRQPAAVVGGGEVRVVLFGCNSFVGWKRWNHFRGRFHDWCILRGWLKSVT